MLRHILLMPILVSQWSTCLRVNGPLFLKIVSSCVVFTLPLSRQKQIHIFGSMKVNYNRSRSKLTNVIQCEHLISLGSVIFTNIEFRYRCIGYLAFFKGVGGEAFFRGSVGIVIANHHLQWHAFIPDIDAF